MTDLADLSIAEAGRQLRTGDISAVDLWEATVSRLAYTEPHLHAFLEVDRIGARASADAADAAFKAGKDAGPLQGIPIALKDNMCTKGLATTASSKMLEGWVPPYDGTAVAKLRSGGIVLVGKTNLDEFAMGSSTETRRLGPHEIRGTPTVYPGGHRAGRLQASRPAPRSVRLVQTPEVQSVNLPRSAVSSG